MRIGIIGAGAIGTWVAVRLGAAGHDITVGARGATSASILQNGLALQDAGGRVVYRPAVADLAGIKDCDLVILAVKAQAVGEIAAHIPGMLTPAGAVMPLINGVPWWFLGSGEVLGSVDPEGMISRAIAPERILAAVVHAAIANTGPGQATVMREDRLIVGEPSGESTRRATKVVETCRAAGLPAELSADIRGEIWFKLWGNMTVNPVSALTLSTIDKILDDPLLTGLIAQVMEEAREIGRSVGCNLAQTTEERNAVTRKLGAFRTSMLQDVEAGRSLEIDALLGAPREIGALRGISTPALDGLLGLTRTMARSRGLY